MIPSTTFKHLGLIYNSRNINIQLFHLKREKILTVVDKFKKNKKYKIRYFAKVLGLLVSCCPAVEYGLVHTKASERIKFRTLH